MIQGVDKRKRRSTIESTPIVQGGGYAHGGFINVWYTEVDLPHGVDVDCKIPGLSCPVLKRSRGKLPKSGPQAT